MDATEEKPVSQDRMLVSHSLFVLLLLFSNFRLRKSMYYLFYQQFWKYSFKKVYFLGRKNGAEQCASFQTMLLQIGLLFIYVIGIFGFIGFLGRPINCWVGLVYNKLTS